VKTVPQGKYNQQTSLIYSPKYKINNYSPQDHSSAIAGSRLVGTGINQNNSIRIQCILNTTCIKSCEYCMLVDKITKIVAKTFKEYQDQNDPDSLRNPGEFANVTG